MTEPVVVTEGLTRVYGTGPTAVVALDGVDLRIGAGEFVVLLGPSGSGKTTLLNLIGGIDRPTSGRVLVDGVDVGEARGAELTRYRRHGVGFVFQFFNLVPTLTALENVELIAALAGAGTDEARAALDAVGVAELADRFPGQLSGGQQQRVAIARALAKAAPLVLGDEPTGALDRANGAAVLALLRSACDTHGRVVVVVSHDPDVARVADRVLRLVDGRIVDDAANPSPLRADEVVAALGDGTVAA